MSIAENVKARQAAEDAFSLMSDCIRESVAGEAAGRAWELVREMLDGVLPDRKVDGSFVAMTDSEKRRFEKVELPFGKHKGSQIKDVPMSYLQWIDEDDFRNDLRRYLKHPDVWREQGD